MVPLMSFKEYLTTVYHSKFIISDSGTGQEEPALLGTPTIVPRDFTERPQSYEAYCSKKFIVEAPNHADVWEWVESLEVGRIRMDTSWLGDGTTSQQIIAHLRAFFGET
jgi:UDP-N-acetylglucosamine 2-epimerase